MIGLVVAFAAHHCIVSHASAAGAARQRSNSGWDVASAVMPGAINFNDADIKRAGLPVQAPLCQTAGGMWEG